MIITRNEAIKISEAFSLEIKELLKERLLAVFAIGSLGSDYYRAGQSDIDTVIITDFKRCEIYSFYPQVRQIADRYWREYNIPKGFGAIIFAEEQLYPPYFSQEELVLEIIRLKVQSKIIFGEYDINSIPMPPKEAIIKDAVHFQEWADSEKRNNPNSQIDSLTTFVNSTLMALKRYLMISCGIYEFNKFKIIDLYMKNDPPMVNDKIFNLINAYLHESETSVTNEEFREMIKWHDELFSVINNLTLYADMS